MSPFSDLTPLDEAVATIVSVATELRDARPPATRQVGLWDASGYVLAKDAVADRDQPPFAKAMMDGYAVRAEDVRGPLATLDVVGEVPAGSEATAPLAPGQAMAIMTGAPMPEGADSVQMVEKTRREGGRVTLEGPITAGLHVAAQGEDVRAGEVVVERGRVIESLTAGVLGSVGASRLEVYQRPRVTVLTTGSELVAIDETPVGGQIRDSNSRTLMALLEREWCRVVDGGIVEDELAATRMAVRSGLESDVLVLSGGVSAGAYDLVSQALAEEGVETVFHKVRVKPGKPVLFGRHAGGLVFGLPGNPVSAFVTGTVLMAPALRVLGRRPEHRSCYLDVPLVNEVPATGGRATFHPADLQLEGQAGLVVRHRRWGGSADQVAYARANALIRREPGAPAAKAGELVRVLLPHSIASW